MDKILKPKCTEKTNQKRIVLAEKRTKSKITFVNSNQIDVEKIKVDGCKITDNHVLKCDFMLKTDGVEYFIELKGQDFNHAIKQLKSTMHILSSKNKLKACFIISTRNPKTSTEIQILAKKFKKEFNAKLISKTSGFEYKIQN